MVKEVTPGHEYLLDNLKDGGQTKFQFYQDPKIHGRHKKGPSSQEVIRMVIMRTIALDKEKHHWTNRLIVIGLRKVLHMMEFRAVDVAIEKGREVEQYSVQPNGHWMGDDL